MSFSESLMLSTGALAIVLLTLIYFYFKGSLSYWEQRGFKSLPNANIIFGHSTKIIFRKESTAECYARIYNNTNEPYVGIYGPFLRPMLVINDLDLIRKILVKDFSHFTDHGVYSNEKKDVLSAHLFALEGQKWRDIRNKLSPAFTSGKLKSMFPTLLDCGSTLQNYIENLVKKNEIFDVREISARFSTNVIASVGFGLDIDTISNPNHVFREMTKQVFVPHFWNTVRYFLRFLAPKIMYALGIRYIDQDVEDYLISLVKGNMEIRKNNNIIRKDIFQMLVQLHHGQSIELNDEWQIDSSSKTMIMQRPLTLNEMAAQTFIFITAGFETSSTTTSYCLYELAKQPEIQQRVQNEMDNVLNEYGGQVTYESLSNMTFLGKCVDETLRKYPIVGFLSRKCVNEYRIPGTNHVIEKGVSLVIPIYALQRDEKYFKEPNLFDPDRWNAENTSPSGITKPNGVPYFPFGDGPRVCIAARLGLMQVKVALVLMLQKFIFSLHESHKNKGELEFDPAHFLLLPNSQIYLHVSKR